MKKIESASFLQVYKCRSFLQFRDKYQMSNKRAGHDYVKKGRFLKRLHMLAFRR